MATARASVAAISSVSRANSFTAPAESSKCRFPRAIVVFRGLAWWPPLFFPTQMAAKNHRLSWHCRFNIYVVPSDVNQCCRLCGSFSVFFLQEGRFAYVTSFVITAHKVHLPLCHSYPLSLNIYMLAPAGKQAWSWDLVRTAKVSFADTVCWLCVFYSTCTGN